MPEHFIDCSEHIVLACQCGEKVILLGREDDWRSRNAIFGCSECGAKLTLDDRIGEEALIIKELVRDLEAPYSRGEAVKKGETA